MIAAYAARGASGFGAAAAMPLLALVIPLKVLIPAWTLIGLAAGITLFGSDRKNIAWSDLARLIPGCLVGIAIGLYVFKLLDSDMLAKGLGIAVLLYGAWSLWSTFRAPPKWTVPRPLAAHVAGVAGGILGTVLGTMASIFFAIYFDVIRLAKENYRATMTGMLLVLGTVRGIGYWAVGEFTAEVLLTFAFAFPLMLIGIFIGNRFHHGMSELTFKRTVSCALIASGLALLAK
jgi:uncharacterized membrane protein YfcA